MYKNFYYNRKDNMCHLWSDGLHGESLYEKFRYEPYAYELDDEGTYKTLTGRNVVKVYEWDKKKEQSGHVFEHDIPIATRVLIDRYYESDEPSTQHSILFFDIEIEKGKRYSTPTEALNTITSIAYYFDEKYYVLLLDRENKIKVESDVNVVTFQTEEKLLMDFLSRWNKIKPTIVSAYNGDYFDIPYLVNRMKNVLGWAYAKKLSPIGVVENRQVGKDTFIKIAGVSQMDYLQLYKKFTYNEESSYTLDSIAKKELGRGKVQYTGTLDELFKNDINAFIAYNVTDVELMVALDKKMDLIAIARGICHKGHVPYDDYQFSSRYLDGAIATRCKRKGLVTISNLNKMTDYEVLMTESFIKVKSAYISVDKIELKKIKDKAKIYAFDPTEQVYEQIGSYLLKKQKKSLKNKIIVSSGKAQGAFVKPPKVGKHSWVYSIDLQSLYPNLIITQNNSIEMQVGVINNWDQLHFPSKLSNDLKSIENFGYLADDVILEVNEIKYGQTTDKVLKLNKSQFIDFVGKYDASISSAGVIFDTRTKGIIPEILEEWFNERILYKNRMKDHKEGSIEYADLDRKQLITKILLNSLYGVLLLPSFRYYSRLSGESVTLSGQSVIKFSDFIINLYYKNKLKDQYKTNCVVYQDSDSCYLDAKPLIEKIDSLTDIECILAAEKVSSDVTQFINKSIKWFTTHCFHSNNNRLKFNEEKVSKRAFWGQAKKRYAQLSVEIVNGEVKEKVDIKGFDVVRSSFPKSFRKIMKELIVDILHDKDVDELNQTVRDFKRIYKTNSIVDIMLPSSVKEISKFEYNQKGTPIHVKSAQNYNQLLTLFNIDDVSPIVDGDKILYAYVKQNSYGFETIALKGQGEDDPRIVKFVEQYMDKDKVFETSLISKLDTIWYDLGWDKVQLTEQNNFF
jgi:DNA polymerase elongation subunit (family B)